MAYYKICSSCLANLDPGERCDCEREVQEEKSSFYKKMNISKQKCFTFCKVNTDEKIYNKNITM